MNNKKKTKAQRSNYQKYFPMIIFISILFMSVGYAVINSINLNIDGEAIAKEQSGVYITEATYHSNVSANTSSSKIINAYQSMLQSDITLSSTNASSSITYQVTVYNSTSFDYLYNGVNYELGTDTYSNEGISVTVNDLNVNDTVASKSYKTFTIVFSYKDGTLASSNNLKSYITFDFILKPTIVGEYSYTGEVKTFTAPYTGTYKIELWGAQGGSTSGADTNGVTQDYLGGKGGYSTGEISLSTNQQLFIIVGGQGLGSCVEQYCAGGYNGGGNSGVSTEDKKNYTCSGGGATHVALTNRGELLNYEAYQNEVILVAGGGGGGYYHEFGEKYSILGGAGGGIQGVDGTLSEYSPDSSTTMAPRATGGTQTTGGIGGYRGADGSFGLGGSGPSCETTKCGSSGGGGGWYGGGAAGHSGTGGGSGYISSSTTGETVNGNTTMPTHDGTSTMTGNTGNGYAKITFIKE